MNLPTVQALTHKKPLLLYLVLSPSAIGELIAQKDEGGIKQLVYYVNHALKDAETSYPQAERMLQAILRYPVSMEIHKGRSSAQKSIRLRSFLSTYSKWVKKEVASTGVGTVETSATFGSSKASVTA